MDFLGGSGSKESACNAGDPLEKGMATHSSILAWRILWTEEPGRLLSMVCQWGCRESDMTEQLTLVPLAPSLMLPVDNSEFLLHPLI